MKLTRSQLRRLVRETTDPGDVVGAFEDLSPNQMKHVRNAERVLADIKHSVMILQREINDFEVVFDKLNLDTEYAQELADQFDHILDHAVSLKGHGQRFRNIHISKTHGPFDD